MPRALAWIWKKGIVSTFLAGFFVVLPIAITIALMGWVGGTLADWFGPNTVIGEALREVGGLKFETSETMAYVLGWVIVLAAIWLLGLLVKSMGKNKVEKTFHAAIEQIPIVSTLYKPVAQVVDMLKQDGQGELEGMSVVYCAFGSEGGAGFLGLLVSHHAYRFNGRKYQVVYIPTSPVPMSGGIVFAPVESVLKVDMKVEDLMQIYFSIGVMSPQVIPKQYVVPAIEPGTA